MRTDDSSPSNVSLAAGSETLNPACTLADVARSTPAGDIELSSSALFFLDNSFEGLIAMKNTPPLRITSSSFPLFLAIQHRSFTKYTSQPESIMGRRDQIDRLMSNERYSSVSFRAVSFLLPAMVSFHSICEGCPLGRFRVNTHALTHQSIMVNLHNSWHIVFSAGHVRDLGQSFSFAEGAFRVRPV